MDAIIGTTALLGVSLNPVPDAVVLLAEGRIAAAGPRSSVQIPDGADVFDGTGMTLVPGFIDSHVHIGFYEPRSLLLGGTTTARDLAWPPRLIWPLVESSLVPDRGPLLVAAGQMLTAPGGYPMRAAWAPQGTGRVVASPGDASAAVTAQADRGACVIKVALNPSVGPTLDRATLEAIVAAARERGLGVTGHVAGVDELVKALDAGMGELAHMLMSSDAIPAELIERMVTQKTVIVPTLAVRYGADRRRAIANLEAFLAGGGTVVYGTDLGNFGPRPGIDRREVTAMEAAGMAPRDIVVAATRDAARHLRLSDRGVITEGMVGDLVVLDRPQLERARDLVRVGAVWRQGIRAR
ncbi:MAG: amidohydrolase family protein [Actinomycetota bacterium]|nr:amidohydrolase family protein [Actinomycetota bacterium]